MEHFKLRITSCMARLDAPTNSLISLAIGSCNHNEGRISQSVWIALWALVLAALCTYGMSAHIHDELLDRITAVHYFVIFVEPSPKISLSVSVQPTHHSLATDVQDVRPGNSWECFCSRSVKSQMKLDGDTDRSSTMVLSLTPKSSNPSP